MAGRVPTVRSAGRMASARFLGCRRPAARGMKRSLPYVMRQHSWAADRTLRPALNGSDHHRYGEVKTRLTIDGTGHFAWYYHIILEYYFWRLGWQPRLRAKARSRSPSWFAIIWGLLR